MIIQNRVDRTVHLEGEHEFFVLRYRVEGGGFSHVFVFSVTRRDDDYLAVGYPYDVATGNVERRLGAERRIPGARWASPVPFRVTESLR